MLTIHESYSEAEAIAAFSPDQVEGTYCDGQFVVLSNAILCLATGDQPGGNAFFPTASQFIWKPRYHTPGDPSSWLPAAVRNANHQQKQIHIFVRREPNDQFYYIGTAYLGSYGFSGSEASASFSLKTFLSYMLWIYFGGYPGLRIRINEAVYDIEVGDLKQFISLLEPLLNEPYGNITLMQYVGLYFQVLINPTRGCVIYSGFSIIPPDAEYSGDPQTVELFYCTCGIPLERLGDETLPRTKAIQAAQEFFLTGDIPEWLNEADAGAS